MRTYYSLFYAKSYMLDLYEEVREVNPEMYLKEIKVMFKKKLLKELKKDVTIPLDYSDFTICSKCGSEDANYEIVEIIHYEGTIYYKSIVCAACKEVTLIGKGDSDYERLGAPPQRNYFHCVKCGKEHAFKENRKINGKWKTITKCHECLSIIFNQ